MKHLIICLAGMLWALCVSAQTFSLSSRSSVESLEEEGNRFYRENKRDSAMMCFSLIAENNALRGSTNAVRARAYNKCGHLYYQAHNLPTAYQCFLKAIRQGDDYETNKAKIYLSVIYSYLGDYPKMIDYARDAWVYAVRRKDYTNFLTIHANIINAAFANDQLISEVKLMNDFNTIIDIPPSPLHTSIRATNAGMLDIVGHRYDSAISNFQKSYDALEDIDGFIPYRVCALENISKAYALKGDYADAVASLERANGLASANNLLEMKAQNLKLMSDYLEKAGLTDSALVVRMDYVTLKDSIMNAADINSVHDLQANYDISLVRDELFRANVVSRMQTRLFWGAAAFAFVLVILVVFLLRTVKAVRRSNRNLYLRNSELMGLIQRVPVDDEAVKEESEDSVEADSEIHKNDSGMSQIMSDEILCAVNEVMSRPEDFCSSGFSIDRLSRLVGYNSKYVSIVVNQRIGKTFRQWLAECRIRQACVLMTSYAREGREVSVEFIAEEVGIKSRSNFSQMFKQLTGMSPKEFYRQAKG